MCERCFSVMAFDELGIWIMKLPKSACLMLISFTLNIFELETAANTDDK